MRCTFTFQIGPMMDESASIACAGCTLAPTAAGVNDDRAAQRGDTAILPEMGGDTGKLGGIPYTVTA